MTVAPYLMKSKRNLTTVTEATDPDTKHVNNYSFIQNPNKFEVNHENFNSHIIKQTKENKFNKTQTFQNV